MNTKLYINFKNADSAWTFLQMAYLSNIKANYTADTVRSVCARLYNHEQSNEVERLVKYVNSK
jgi:hypothetical protein